MKRFCPRVRPQGNRLLQSLGAADGASRLQLAPVIAALLASPSAALLCPALPLPDDGSGSSGSGSPAPLPTPAVFSGCPCNTTRGAATFACPAGYRCSREAVHGLPSDAVRTPTLAMLGALCAPCTQGQYCPRGTYLEVRAFGQPS